MMTDEPRYEDERDLYDHLPVDILEEECAALRVAADSLEQAYRMVDKRRRCAEYVLTKKKGAAS